MPKSRRERKERRRAKQLAEAAVTVPEETDVRGPGERTIRGESGLTQIKEARLVERAVRWNKSMRWPTRMPVDELRTQTDGVDVITRATQAAIELLDGDDRAKGIAVRAIVQMERQNQADEQKILGSGIPSSAPTTQVNVNVGVSVNGTPDERRLRLTALAARRGIGRVDPAVPAGSAVAIPAGVDRLPDRE